MSKLGESGGAFKNKKDFSSAQIMEKRGLVKKGSNDALSLMFKQGIWQIR